MSKKLPYLPLYTGDWKKDTALSMCTPATRGIWIDILCAMHDDDQCGQVSGTPEELACLARCTASQLKAAAEELGAKKAAHVTKRNGKVTITNRKMNRAYKLRVGARLRKRKSRSDDGGHKEVTHLSSMSLSNSRSTVDRRDDQKCELSEDQMGVVRSRANEVAKKVGKRATEIADRSLVLKAAILSLRTPFSEHWLYDAAEGVSRVKGRKRSPYGYLHKCLADSAAKLGCKFNTELAKTHIPESLLQMPAGEPMSERLCVAEEPA